MIMAQSFDTSLWCLGHVGKSKWILGQSKIIVDIRQAINAVTFFLGRFTKLQRIRCELKGENQMKILHILHNLERVNCIVFIVFLAETKKSMGA